MIRIFCNCVDSINNEFGDKMVVDGVSSIFISSVMGVGIDAKNDFIETT